MRRYFCWIVTLTVIVAWAIPEARAEHNDENTLLLELDKAIEQRRDYAENVAIVYGDHEGKYA